MIVDINKQELNIGDRILAAFSSCGYTYLEYATITKIEDGYNAKVKVNIESNLFKTKTLNVGQGKARVYKL